MTSPQALLAPTASVQASVEFGAPELELCSVAVHRTTEAEVIEHVVACSKQAVGGRVYSVNLDILRMAHADPAIAEMVGQGEIRIPDGMPIVWAGAIARARFPMRVAGSTLIQALARRASAEGLPVYLLGGNPGIADKAAGVLLEDRPSLHIAGTYCPPFGYEDDPAELRAIVDAVCEARPAMVFVALGFPRQERLIEALRVALPHTWFVSCGIAFSFLAGDLRRAPVWMQYGGIEWMHRLAQEPRRLFRRYVLQDLPFAPILLREALGQRSVRKSRESAAALVASDRR